MRKISLRIEDELFKRLHAEYREYGYRSLSAYISTILGERVLIELKGSDELASLMRRLKILSVDNIEEKEKRRELCQLYDSLTMEIENLRSCVKRSIISNDPDGSQENT